jgi:hypothetical protein
MPTTAANLGPFQDNGGPNRSLMPLSSSLAVNGGSNAGCPPNEQRGTGRPQGATVISARSETPCLTPPVITFHAPADRILSNTPFSVSASSTWSLPVSISTLTPGVAVAGNSFTMHSYGLCTIRASQGGDAKHSAAPNVDRSFNVLRGWFLPVILRQAGSWICVATKVRPQTKMLPSTTQ